MSNHLVKADAEKVANADIGIVSEAQAQAALTALGLGKDLSVAEQQHTKVLGGFLLQNVAGNIAVQGQIYMGDVAKMREELWSIIKADSTDPEIRMEAISQLKELISDTFTNIATAQLKAAEIVGIAGKAKKQNKRAPQIRNNVTVAVQNNRPA